MPVNACRVCGHSFIDGPLLRYANMPGAAQFFPDAKALTEDRGVDLEVCQCSSCGLVQLSNEAVPYYREVIRASAVSEEMRQFRAQQFGRFIEEYALRGKKVLEVGCGRGEYLSILQQGGAKAHGLEYSRDSVAQCIAGGLCVSRGFIDNTACELEGAPFSAFMILSYLEHLPDPNGTLGGVRRHLVDGGVGLVEVPNFDMILRQNLFSEFTTDHLSYFTEDTLRTTLALNGFEIVDCRAVWHDYILSAVVRKRDKLDLSRFSACQSQVKKEIEGYLRRYGGKKAAIWGAGHQALAMIALTGLADKIRYVIDSAPFKQNKFTPATHVPIVSPDVLESDPVDAIIVMAASYSDEVARIIRHRFNRNINVSILRVCGLEKV